MVKRDRVMGPAVMVWRLLLLTKMCEGIDDLLGASTVPQSTLSGSTHVQVPHRTRFGPLEAWDGAHLQR